MNKLLKRIVAGVCTVTMLTGICVIQDSMLANAEAELPQKEWSVITEAEQWRTDSKYVLHDCDTVDTYGKASVENGALKFEGTDNTRFQYNYNTGWDLSGYMNGTLHLALCVDNKDNLPSDNIQLILSSGSATNVGANEVAYQYISKDDLAVGELGDLYIDMAAFTCGTTFNWTKVTKLKIALGKASTNAVTTTIDDIYVTREKQDYVLHDCDSVDGVTVGGGNTKELDESGAIKVTGSAGNRFQTGPFAANLSGYTDGKLYLKFYINDATKLSADLDIQLGTGGLTKKYDWYYPKGNLTNGWNEIYIDLANPASTHAEFNWANVQYFKIFLQSSESVTIMIDDIRLQGNSYKKNVSIQTNDAGLDQYALYFTAEAKNQTALNALKNATVEVSQDTKANLKMPLSALSNQTWQVGENIVYVDFSEMKQFNGYEIVEGATTTHHFDLSSPITSFQINSVSDYLTREDVKFTKIDIVDTTPYVVECEDAVAGTNPNLANIPEGYVFAGWYQDAECKTVYTSDAAGTAHAKYVNGDLLNTKAQYLLEDEDVLIANCDTDTAVGRLVTDSGFYKEGHGAIQCENIAESNVIMQVNDGRWNLSAYSDGKATFHMWIYTEGLTSTDVIQLQLSDSEEFTNFITRDIKVSDLEANAWTELKFDWNITGEWLGNASCFRILAEEIQLSDAAKIIVDDICFMQPDIEQEYVLHDCDTVDSYGKASVENGALKFEGTDNTRFQYNYNTGWDLSGYMNGTLHLALCVDNKDNLPSDNIQLILSSGSATNVGANEVAYQYISKDDLAVGELGDLYIDMAAFTCGTTFNWTKVTKLKIALGKASTNAVTTTIDDIYVTREKQDYVLHDCDSVDGVTVGGGNTKELDESGAIKVTGSAGNRFQTGPFAANLSGYTDGKLYLKFYINDATKLSADLDIQLGTGGLTKKYDWYYPKGNLTNGWNEIYIDLANPASTHAEFNWANVQYFKIFLQSSESVTIMIDDIRIIQNKELRQQASLRFSTTVDSLKYQEVGFEIKIGDKDWKDAPSNTVYKQIYAQGSNRVLTYSPKVFAAQSNYFNTYEIWDIRETNFDTDIQVRAYWITQDGTKVVSDVIKEFTINEAIASVGN